MSTKSTKCHISWFSGAVRFIIEPVEPIIYRQWFSLYANCIMHSWFQSVMTAKSTILTVSKKADDGIIDSRCYIIMILNVFETLHLSIWPEAGFLIFDSLSAKFFELRVYLTLSVPTLYRLLNRDIIGFSVMLEAEIELTYLLNDLELNFLGRIIDFSFSLLKS